MGRPSPYGGIGYPQHWEKIMIWLQENWIIAVVGLVVAVVLLWWLFGRAKPGEIVPPAIEPAKPAKPLEPAKPEIIAAEPARFKPIEPKPQPVVPAAPPPPRSEENTSELPSLTRLSYAVFCLKNNKTTTHKSTH